jgi:phosphatidylserine decarboxylase
MTTKTLKSTPKADCDTLGGALHRCVTSSHHDDVDLPEGLMPGDHASVPHHWWGKYASDLSEFAESYSTAYKWGNEVVDRSTGQKVWEPMPLYTRIGMHLLFVGKYQDEALEDGYLERLFLKESLEQGKHFDAPESVSKIPHFIKQYKIPTDELLITDLSGYKNFNEFFYRKLRPDARIPEEPENPLRITSPADCRSVVFETVDVTKYWIKGKEFTVGTLIQDDEMAKGYSHIAIFRLAPQDYHRFHAPVDCTIGKHKDIVGNLYTVNPMAVREKLDVFTQNKRSVMALHTPNCPRPILFVAVGAMLVGSIAFTVEEGQQVKKGQDMGYFAYGGSTVIILFPEELGLEFDSDMAEYSKEGFETIFKVGMGIAKCNTI